MGLSGPYSEAMLTFSIRQLGCMVATASAMFATSGCFDQAQSGAQSSLADASSDSIDTGIADDDAEGEVDASMPMSDSGSSPPSSDAGSPPPTDAGSPTSDTPGPGTSLAICSGELETKVPQLSDLQPRRIQTGFKGAEGIVWVASEERLYFSEINRNRQADGITWQEAESASIVRLDPVTGAFERWVEASGTNGLALSPDAKVLFAAAHDRREVSIFRLSDALRSTRAAQRADGTAFNSPNDIAVRSDGHIYMTDPSWQLEGADIFDPPAGSTPAIWVKPSGEATVFDADLIHPNGVSLSPDEKTLYVTGLVGTPREFNWQAPAYVYAYTIADDGSVSDRRVFGELPVGADGMTLDCAGNLYATVRGNVIVFDESGEELGRIRIAPDSVQVSNAAFGGPERTTLFVTVEATGATPEDIREYAVYAVDMNIPGIPY